MQQTDSRSAIEAKSRLFEDRYNAGDAAGLVAGYFVADADAPAAYAPGGQPPVRGRDALVAMFSAMIPDAPHIRLELVDLTVSDDLAFEVGLAHLTGADGTPAHGRYTVCWIARDGDWRAKVDFFAADGWTDRP